jgi:hydroxyethylthiazole kinase-like uncharacterized protein yjeF
MPRTATPTEISPALLDRFPLPDYTAESDKSARGKLLVIAGSRRLPGAALLASRAALRTGCGGVRVATVESVATHIGIAVPELMVVPLRETPDGSIALTALPTLTRQYVSCQAAVIGPGIDETLETDRLARHVIETAPLPLVVDAQAILALPPANPIRARAPRLYTPHAKEMAALTGRTEAQIAKDREGAARDFARAATATLVLKGRETLIATPKGDLFLNTAGSRALGTAGSGDTLAGVCGSLLAQGLDPTAAAIWAVYLHALAGEAVARTQGEDGPLASDFILQLPATLRTLRERSV